MEKIKENKILFILLLFPLIGIIIFIYSRQGDNFKYELPDHVFLKNYGINEMIWVTMNEEQIAKFYLAEYIGLIVSDPERAYNLLDAESKKIFPKLSDFNIFVNSLENELFYSATLLKYNVDIDNGERIYSIFDANNNHFIFREKSILNYVVSFS